MLPEWRSPPLWFRPAARRTPAPIRSAFIGREIFPIENGISQLHVADLDGDGLNDLVVVNNARSRITILYNQTGKTNLTQKPRQAGKGEINELPPDARFRIESIASEKRISALVVADLNGDGKPDIAYYGEPNELVVHYNQGTNGWSAPKRWPIDDGQLSQNALVAGDLNGDGRNDLVLLSEKNIYFLAQKEDHTLAEPQKIPLSSPVKAVQVLDVDGDGRSDLLLVNWEDRNPFRFRLQKENGELGPENYFPMTPIRSYWADNLETNSKVQVITIAQNSGRAQISQFTRKPAEPLSGAFRQGQFQVLPLNKTDKARRGIVVGRRQRRWLAGFARGRTGERADFDLLPGKGRLAVDAQNFPDARRHQRSRRGGLGRRRQAGDFHVERGRKANRRDAARRKAAAAVSHADSARWQTAGDGRRHVADRRETDARRHRGQGRQTLARHAHRRWQKARRRN